MYIYLFLLLICTRAQWDIENDLRVLNDTNVNLFVDSTHLTMIFFYTPGCGPCEKFQPQVEKAANLLQEEGIFFGKVDGDKHKDVAKQFGITGFPSLIYFIDGVNTTKYEGGRTYDAILIWYYEQINPGSKEIKTIDQLKEEIESHQTFIIFFGDDPKDRTFRRYRDQSYTTNITNFGHIFIKDAAKLMGISTLTQIAAFKKGQSKPILFKPKQLTIQNFKIFVEMVVLPRPGEWSPEIQKRVYQQDKQVLLLLSNGDQQSEQDFIKYSQGYTYDDYLLFVLITPQSRNWPQLLDDIGVKEEQLNEKAQLFTLTKNGTIKYQYQLKTFNIPDIDKFIIDARDGKIQRYLKSQNLQITKEMNIFSSLEVLDAESYTNKMLQSVQDWVVFYCKFNLQEHRDVLKVASRVAVRLSKNPNVKFGFIDVSQNELIDFNEDTEIIKIRFYKGAPPNKKFLKFTMKANKLQDERLINFIFDQTSFQWIKAREEL